MLPSAGRWLSLQVPCKKQCDCNWTAACRPGQILVGRQLRAHFPVLQASPLSSPLSLCKGDNLVAQQRLQQRLHVGRQCPAVRRANHNPAGGASGRREGDGMSGCR